MDFENFCNSYVPEPEKPKNSDAEKVFKQNVDETDIKEKINKYKNYSDSQLLNELIKEVSKQKKEGKLTDNKMQDIVAGIMPYLDETQRKKLNDILILLR